MRAVEDEQEREHRIDVETVVDAYDEVEGAIEWYCCLDSKLHFPFKAKCIAKRLTSPLREGETFQVVRMAPEGECMHEMFVVVTWQDRKLAVRLSQLMSVGGNRQTREAIGDGHYWVRREYQF